jgi:hypothetical protein
MNEFTQNERNNVIFSCVSGTFPTNKKYASTNSSDGEIKLDCLFLRSTWKKKSTCPLWSTLRSSDGDWSDRP